VIRALELLIILLMSSHFDEPFDFGWRLYVSFATKLDTMTLIHFDSLRRYHTYDPLMRMLRRRDRRFFMWSFINQQTVNQFYRVGFSQNTAFIIVGAVFDRRVVDHQAVIRKSYDSLVVFYVRLRFDV